MVSLIIESIAGGPADPQACAAFDAQELEQLEEEFLADLVDDNAFPRPVVDGRPQDARLIDGAILPFHVQQLMARRQLRAIDFTTMAGECLFQNLRVGYYRQPLSIRFSLTN